MSDLSTLIADYEQARAESINAPTSIEWHQTQRRITDAADSIIQILKQKTKVHMGRTGAMEYSEVLEIGSFEEVIEIMHREGHPIIVGKPWTFAEEYQDCQASLEIYDGYRE